MPSINATVSLNDIDRAVSANIRRAREARGWTLQGVADALSISHQQMSKYEKAQNRVTAGRLRQLAWLFNADVNELFTGITRTGVVK